MADPEFPLTETKYGFTWGPAIVERMWSYERGLSICVRTPHGKQVDIFVSPTGRVVRVHDPKKRRELK